MAEPSVLLHAVGDIAFGDHPLCAGFGTHSQARRREPAFMFEHVRGELARADLRFGNLECTLSESGLRRSAYHSMQMRGQPAYVEGLTAAGFHVLNVANNHSQQHGPAPFTDTVEMLDRAGIGVCGLKGPDGASRLVLRPAGGLTVGFIGYSLRPRQYFTEEPLYAEGHHDAILADVARTVGDCDVLVVSLHWGDEFIQRPSPAEVRLARAVIDAGARLVIGHHPHVLRGVEQHGAGWIVYSLGNFVCDMLWEERLRETAICECRLTRQGVESLRLIPARINDSCQPVPLHGEDEAKLQAHLRDLSRLIDGRGVADEVAAYAAEAETALVTQRARSHRYFLKNVYRFPPGILAGQVATFLRNRLAERGWVRQETS